MYEEDILEVIIEVLDRNDGVRLDNPKDRLALAHDLHGTLVAFYQNQ
jgi:hypothetical protein